MSFNVFFSLFMGCILGIFSSVVLIGLAFAINARNKRIKEEQEETDKHE